MASPDRSLARLGLVSLAAAVVLLGGCGGDGDPDVSAPGDGPADQPRPVVDWVEGYDVDLGDGWGLTPCEGGPALMCIRRDGETQGVAELMTYSTGHYEEVAAVIEAGGSREEALAAVASDFHRVFVEDRPVGCGAGYGVEPFGPTPVTVGGLPGVTYGFEGVVEGRRVERAVQFAAMDERTLYMIATTAVEDGTCMDDGELEELTIAEIGQLEDDLGAAIAGSRLPVVEWCDVRGVVAPCDAGGVRG